MEVIAVGARHKHYYYLQNKNVFRSLAKGLHVKSGTSHNEAEHRIMKAWMECVYMQHVDRLESMGCLFGFYKMLDNTYNASRLEDSGNYRERRVVQILSGMIASGSLTRIGDGAPQQQHAAPQNRDAVYRPVLEVPECVRELRATQAKRRSETHTRHVSMDLTSGKAKLKLRLPTKTHVRNCRLRIKRPRTKSLKSSQAIHDAVSGSLAEDLD